jgi:hypothetical protein
MANNDGPEPPGKGALSAAADVIKYLTALATGAIVFSAGLLNEKIFLSVWAKWLIFLSWCLLALSVAGGLLAGMRVPIQLSKQNYNLQNKYFEWPIRVQQIAFFCGIVALGAALSLILIGHNKERGDTDNPPPPVTPSPQPSPLPSPQPSVTPGVTPSPAPTPISSPTPSIPTPTPMPTPTGTPSPTASPTPLPPSRKPKKSPRGSSRRRCRCGS